MMSQSNDFLADEFDVIVVGTGLSESIIAAAASRAGKSVLHVDSNDYYGSEWSSFWYNKWNEWIQFQQNKANDEDRLYENIEKIDYTDGKSDWSEEKLNEASNKFAIDLTARMIYSSGPMAALLQESNICRYVSFRECTHFLLASCEEETIAMKEVPCTRSDVFNDATLSLIQKRKLMKFIDEFERKRKTLSGNEEGEIAESGELDGSFDEFVKKHSLDPLLVNLLKCVTLSRGNSSVADALKKLNLFTKSAGRYGRTPFLWTLYGSGELPQAFCRLCAVFGGSYCLKCQPVQGHLIKIHTKQVTDDTQVRKESVETSAATQSDETPLEWRIKVTLRFENHLDNSASGSSDGNFDEKNVTCKYLVSGVHCSSKNLLQHLYNDWCQDAAKTGDKRRDGREARENEDAAVTLEKRVNSSHVVCLTTKSISKADESGNQVSLAIFPAGYYGKDTQVTSDVVLIQLCPKTLTVPSGLHLVYASCINDSSGRTARQLLEPLIDKLFTSHPSRRGEKGEDKIHSSILSCYYFDKVITREHQQFLHQCSTNLPQTFLLNGPVVNEVVDYDAAILEAKKVFHQMYPHCQFLPKAPDSEDIIFEDDKEQGEVLIELQK